MLLKSYCAMDLHHIHTVFEAQTASGEVRLHRDVATEPSRLIECVKSVRGPKGVVIEECPMADWAMRVIRPYVDEVIVCEPRHNRLISEGGDKDDKIDPGNLIKLYRLGNLKAVHHPERQSMMDLRGWVWAYHDQVELVTAAKNKIKAALRSAGIQYGKADVYSIKDRKEWLGKLTRKSARERVEVFYANLDDLGGRRDRLYDRLTRVAQRHPVARRFLAIPGYGPVRAMTFLVMVDTPFRFRTPQKLWQYSGLGLRRHGSGDSRRTKLLPPVCYNRRLKAVARGAMEIALGKGDGNPFERYCQHLLERGVKESLARLSTARKMLTVPWGMWRGGRDYDPALVFRN
jgi:transposase